MTAVTVMNDWYAELACSFLIVLYVWDPVGNSCADKFSWFGRLYVYCCRVEGRALFVLFV